MRGVYEHVTPTAAALLQDAPDAHVCRFSPDGRFLVRLSRSLAGLALLPCPAGRGRLVSSLPPRLPLLSYARLPLSHLPPTRQLCMGAYFQQLVVYDYTGRCVSAPGEGAGAVGAAAAAGGSGAAASTSGRGRGAGAGAADEPPGFGAFFRPRYRLPLAGGQEQLCRDFCLFLRGGRFALLASQSPTLDAARAQRPLPPAQLPGLPVAETTTLHVVRSRRPPAHLPRPPAAAVVPWRPLASACRCCPAP